MFCLFASFSIKSRRVAFGDCADGACFVISVFCTHNVLLLQR